MGLPQKKRATYQDLLAVPEPLVAEIIDGELLTSPRPGLRDDRWMLLRTFENDDKARAEPFEAVELDLAELRAD